MMQSLTKPVGCLRRFNAGLSGEPERTIVTSTGPFIVAWNFRQVKSGNINNYTLRRFSEEVVADNFKFGGDREIVSSGGILHKLDRASAQHASFKFHRGAGRSTR